MQLSDPSYRRVAPLLDTLKDWRIWLVVIGLVASAGTGAGMLADAGLGGARPLRVVVCLIALALAPVVLRDMVRLVKPNPLIVLFVAWSVASLIWTRSLGETLTTLAGLGGVVLFAAVLATMRRGTSVEMLLMWTFTATTLISYAAIYLAPGIGTVAVDHPTEGQIIQPIGIFIWNSDLGFSAAIATIIAISTFFRTLSERNWLLLVVALLNLGIVYLSNAATSVIVLAAGLAVLVLTAGRKVTLPVVGVGLIGAVAGSVAFGFTGLIDKILGLLGRSSTLTGRVDLWKSTLEQAKDTPVLGKGAGVEPDFAGLSNAVHSHNGFVQIYFDRGLVGAILVVLVFLFALYRCARQREWLGLALVVMVVMANVANNYLSYASLGLLLLMWQAFAQTPGGRDSTPTTGSADAELVGSDQAK